MTNLITRTISGAFFVFVVIAAILWNSFAFAAVFAVFTAWSMLEFYQIVSRDGAKPSRVLGTITGVALFFSVFICKAFNLHLIIVFATLVPLMAAIFISRLYIKGDTAFRGLAYTLAGLLYVAVPFALLNSIVFPPYNPHVVYSVRSVGYTPDILLGFFIMLWTNDTFAYLAGSTFGRHRLFERISPKKSWEGFIGGLAGALVMSLLMAKLFPALPCRHWLVIAAIIVVFGVFGDLLESLLKRNMGLKDSGHFLPGHGGILDRFDASLLAAPVVSLYLWIIALFLGN